VAQSGDRGAIAQYAATMFVVASTGPIVELTAVALALIVIAILLRDA
jgi:hypothetical protein